MWNLNTVISWFPPEWAQWVFYYKGAVSIISVVLLIVHMLHGWPGKMSRGQRSRYYTLLAFAVLIAGSTLEQLQEGQPLSYRHLGSAVVSTMLVISMLISIHENKCDVPDHRH